ncbi:MAG: ABC transporter ATP-binding protein [Cyanobacteria bacterium J06623_7]
MRIKPWSTLSLLGLTLVNTACNVAATILAMDILAIALDSEPLSITLGWFAGRVGIQESVPVQHQLAIALTILLAIFLLKQIGVYLNSLIDFCQVKAVVFHLKHRAIKLLAQADLDYFYCHPAADILLQFNREFEQTALAVRSRQKIGILAVTISIMTIVSLVIAWPLTLVASIFLGCTMACDNWLLAQERLGRIARSAAAQTLNRQITEFIAGIRSIKTVNGETVEAQAIAESLQVQHRVQYKSTLVSTSLKPLTQLSTAVLFFILAISSYYLYDRSITKAVPIFLTHATILFWLLPNLHQLAIARRQYLNWNSNIAATARFFSPPAKVMPSRGNLLLTQLEQGISLKQITFAYSERQPTIFAGIDLEIATGKRTALVGLGQNGNKAMVDLLYRFYQPIRGQILVDGRELAAYSAELNRAIAVVSHNPFVFSSSLADNIACGVDNATEAEIIAAVKQAKLDSFIAGLPAGLNTNLEAEGIKLSPAQKLQLDLARAFLRQPQLVILDQPERHFQNHQLFSEAIRTAIELLCRDRTVIIMTQQLELAKTADLIAVFRRGKIVETGTHDQLLKRGNIYPRLHSLQFKRNRQSRQLKLAQKIARKLAQNNSSSLTQEIRRNLDSLLSSLEILNQGWFNNDPQEKIILDESFQSAKNTLANLKKYDHKLRQKYNQSDR